MKTEESEKQVKQDRRVFLKTSGVTAAALLATAALPETARSLPALPANPATPPIKAANTLDSKAAAGASSSDPGQNVTKSSSR